MEKTAPVLRIEKISMQDGAGLRTVVFFKGCPLRCAWCSTPESQDPRPERYYQQGKCTRCLRCVQKCPSGALSLSADGMRIDWNREKCTRCLQCAAVCPAQATRVYGQMMTVKQIMRNVLRDEVFYFHSGGGVTLSGGDVLCYPDFVEDLLAACKDSAIHTSAELTMYGDYSRIQKVMSGLDTALIDLKQMDPALHQKWIGKDNKLILENIRRASAEFPDVVFHMRVPLIPGVNDMKENIWNTAKFCEEIPNCKILEFLPYHRLGQETYRYLGREYQMGDLQTMSVESAQERIACLLGEKWPFRLMISSETLE